MPNWKKYRVAQNKLSHQKKRNLSTIDRDFLPEFQNLQRNEFSAILEHFTEIFSILIASRITAFTIFYSVFQNYAEEMDSHL